MAWPTPSEVDAAWDAVDGRRRRPRADRDAIAPATQGQVETRVEMRRARRRDLCRVAAELGADVVAVGLAGQGAIRRALLGSVSTPRGATTPRAP